MGIPAKTFNRRRISGTRLAAHLGLWAWLALVAAGAARAAEGAEAFVIGVEDVLEIRMPDHPELSAKVPVRPDGRITLPLVDDIDAAGLTPEALKARLVEAFKSYVNVPNIAVIVSEINSLRFYVLGEVAKPGVYPLRSATRVLQAIALAGGFTQFAGKDRVVLLRDSGGKQERIEINLKRVTSGEEIAANALLRPGDTLVVP